MPEMELHPRHRRRHVLKASAALAATAALGAPSATAAAASEPLELAAAEAPVALPGSDAPVSRVAGMVVVPLPPLEIVTFNRLAFGPRPGDLDSFRQGGA